MAAARWDLAGGRSVQRFGDFWILYISPGHAEYSGDAEGLLAYAERKGIALS